MKHEVYMTSSTTELYELDDFPVRHCQMIIDGITCSVSITLYTLPGKSQIRSHIYGNFIDNRAYRVKVTDNKEVSKHPDWRKIREQILSEAIKFFSGMGEEYIHRTPKDKDKDKKPERRT